MRFHVVGLPHTQTTDEFCVCAFTAKVIRLCKKLKFLGHTVYLYAGEQNDAPCDEWITCISEEERTASLAGKHYCEASYEGHLPHWQKFTSTVVKEISERAQSKDFVCLIGGDPLKPIQDNLRKDVLVVEFGIGYSGSFAKYRVWESYSWMNVCYGAECGRSYFVDGKWFDAVIPASFEPKLFPYESVPDDYYLFVGRLIERKGFQIAVDVCQKLGKRLIIAGHGNPPAYGQYVGVVGPKERARLMGHAKAVFVPTIYSEPFGFVAVEAQMCGTPVISTDWGAFPETVLHGATGFRCRTLRQFCEATEAVSYLDRAFIHKRTVETYSLRAVAPRYDAYFNRLSTLWGEGWYA